MTTLDEQLNQMCALWRALFQSKPAEIHGLSSIEAFGEGAMIRFNGKWEVDNGIVVACGDTPEALITNYYGRPYLSQRAINRFHGFEIQYAVEDALKEFFPTVLWKYYAHTKIWHSKILSLRVSKSNGRFAVKAGNSVTFYGNTAREAVENFHKVFEPMFRALRPK